MNTTKQLEIAQRLYNQLDEEPTYIQTEKIKEKAQKKNIAIMQRKEELIKELNGLNQVIDKNNETIVVANDIIMWIERIAEATNTNIYGTKKELTKAQNEYHKIK